MIKFKKRILSGMLCVGMLLTACGKTNSDRDKIKESLDDVENIASASDVGEDAIPERLEYEIVDSTGGTGHVVVNADVEASVYDSAKIYTQTPVKVDDEFCKGIAEKMFDGGEYTIVKPLELMTMEELEAERQFWLDAASEMGYDIEGENFNPYYAGEYYSVHFAIEEYNNREDTPSDYKEGQIIYENKIDTELGTITAHTGKIRGKVDGKWWSMKIQTYGNGSGYDSPIISLYPVSHVEIREFTTCDSENDSLYGGANRMSIEEGRKMAKDIVDRLGFGEMEIVEETQCYINGNYYTSEADLYLDGYNFVLMEKHDGTKPVYADNMPGTLLPDDLDNMTEVENNSGFATQFQVAVGVTSTEILGIAFRPMYTSFEKADTVELLSFERVDSIAREFFVDNITEFQGEIDIEITDVVLGHVTVRYDEGQYVLMPVWFYINDISDEYMNRTYGDNQVIIGINAIDGSLVWPNIYDMHLSYYYR